MVQAAEEGSWTGETALQIDCRDRDHIALGVWLELKPCTAVGAFMMAAGAVRTCRELSLEAITESFVDPEELVQAVVPVRPDVPVVKAAAICNSFTVQAV